MQPDGLVRVLLVEDDAGDQLKIQELLTDTSRRYTLDSVATYEDGAAALAGGLVDVCLLDYQLGPRNGLELLDEARTAGWTTPIIVLNALSEEAVERAAMRAGAADYLVKGQFGPHLLDRSIRHALDRAEMAATLRAAERLAEQRRLELARAEGARDAANRSEERIRTILGSISDAFFAVDERGRVTYANPAAAPLLRRYSDEVLGRSIWELHPHAVGSAFNAAYRRATQEGVPVEVEAYYAPFEAWFSVRVFPSTDGGVSVYFHDVTDERRSHEEKSRLAAIVESSTDAIIGKLLDGTITDWNRGAEQLYGYSASEMVGRSIGVVVPRDLVDDTAVLLERIGRGESVLHHKTERQHKDGRRLSVSLSLSPVRDADGKVVGAATIARDVTEQRQRDMALQRYELLAEHTHDIVLFIAEDGHILEANAAAVATYGYDRDELLRLTIADLRALDTQTHIAEQIAKASDGGLVFETEHKRKDGTIFPVEVSSTGAQIGQQRVRLSLIRDISDRRAAEAELRVQSAALHAAANAIAITNRNGTIEWVNPAFSQLTGYTLEEARGNNPRVLRSGQQDPTYYAQLWQTILSGEVWRGRLINRRKDGQTYTEEMTITPVRDAAGAISHFVAVKEDITERMQAEASLREATRELQTAQQIAHLGSWKLDLTLLDDVNRNALHWSDECFRIFGYEPGEVPVTNELFFERVHPDDRSAITAAVARAIREHSPYDIQHRIVLRDGAERMVRERADLIYDPDEGRPRGLVGTVQDITAEYRAMRRQRLLAEASSVFAEAMTDFPTLLQRIARHVGEATGDACTVRLLSQDGSLLEPIASYHTDPALDAAIRSIMPVTQTVDSGMWRPVVRGLRSTRVDLEPGEIPSDASPEQAAFMQQHHVRTIIRVPLIADRIVIGGMSLIRYGRTEPIDAADELLLTDFAARAAIAIQNARLHERVKLERDRVTQLQALTSSLAQAVTPEDVAETCTRHAAAAVGAVAGGIVVLDEARSGLKFIHAIGFAHDGIGSLPPIALSASVPLAEVVRTKRPVWIEDRVSYRQRYATTTQESIPPPAATLAVPLLTSGGQVLGSMGLDFESARVIDAAQRSVLLTMADQCAQALERARLYEAEQRSRSIAELAVHARDEFLSIAAHELKTPVTVISLAAQTLSRGDTLSAADRLSRSMRTLQSGASRLTRLTEDLLDVARLQTGRLKIRAEELDVAELVHRVVTPYDARLSAGQKLEMEAPVGSFKVMADQDRVQQVLTNLLDNAIKYSPDGGTIRIRIQPQVDGCVVRVEDQGIGLPAGSQESIFQPFGRAVNAALSGIPGTGLGLYICRQIIESHGGRLWAESPGENQGTVMHVWFPWGDQPEPHDGHSGGMAIDIAQTGANTGEQV